MNKLEQIKAEAAARLAGKEGVVLVESDTPANALTGARLAIASPKVSALLALASGLGANTQSLKDAVFEDHILDLKESSGKPTSNSSYQYDSMKNGARKRKQLRRIAKRSRQYNRRKARGMSVNHLRKGM